MKDNGGKNNFVCRSDSYNQINLLAGIGCLALIFVLGLVWLDWRFKETIKKETGLYQALVNGITLANEKEYEAAIGVLRPLFSTFREKGFSADELTALIDAYLMSVVKADEPLEFSHDFYELLPFIEEKMPRYGWRMHHVGWYYFRTGDINRAKMYFGKAIDDFEGFGDFRKSADSYWAAALINIAQGDKVLAINNFEIAEERNYRVYNKDIFVADKLAYEHDPWYIRLGMQYKEFWPTIISIVMKFDRCKETQSQ